MSWFLIFAGDEWMQNLIRDFLSEILTFYHEKKILKWGN